MKRITHAEAKNDLEIIVMHTDDASALRAAERLECYIEQQRKHKCSLPDSENDYTPTARARFCNQAGPMGGGCKDSWHVGGNYGSHVCRNPNHHVERDPEKREDEL